MIRGGSVADSGWQDTRRPVIIHGYFPRKRSNSVTIPVNKDRERFTMLARVHDEFIMERRPKWTIFFPPFSTREGGRKLTEGKERREENGEDERLLKKRLVYRSRPSIMHDYILFNRTCSMYERLYSLSASFFSLSFSCFSLPFLVLFENIAIRVPS